MEVRIDMKKIIASRFLFGSGLWRLWYSRNAKKIVFLTLHGVRDENEQGAWLPLRSYVTTGELEKHVKLLGRFFKFVSMDEACKILRGEIEPRDHSIAITFDDGYSNNVEIAYGLLKKFNIPMALFVATGHMQNQIPFWFDKLDYAVQKNIEGEEVFDFEGHPISFLSGDRDSRKAGLVSAIRQILNLIKDDYRLVPAVESLISEIESIKGQSLMDIYFNDVNSKVVTEESLKEFSDHPLATVGSHTHNHIRLGFQEAEKIIWEAQESKRVIEKVTEKECKYFCYPNGVYSNTAASVIKDCGYKAAFTTQEGLNCPAQDMFSLFRINFPVDVPPEYLVSLITGVFPYPRRDIFLGS